jgi:O-antigen/teichoic acid export membrane protein
MTIATPFARRIMGVFATRVVRYAVGFATSFVLARVLGPAGRGAYYLVTLTPTTLVALGQLGLPSAVSFFAGRGRSGTSLLRVSLVVVVVLSSLLIAATLLALPWLEETVLKAAEGELVRLALISLPFQFLASFVGSALIGRQVLRNYNLILVAQSVLMLALIALFVGVLDMGVLGAVLANVTTAGVAALAITVELRRAIRDDPEEPARPGIRIGELVDYGAKSYPASVAGFFNYRADVFLLSAFLGDPAAIGLYSLAVSLAELTFFVPDSVSTVFFPRVASSDRRTADDLAPVVSRFTVLLTGLAVIGLIPVAFGAVYLIIPDFAPSLPPFLIILPGILALSVSKILSSYVSGLGLPLRVAFVSSSALGVNLVANLVLIPLYGIHGAAAASLISYTAHALMLLVITSRLSHRSPLAYLVPTGAEWQRLRSGLRELRDRSSGRRPPTAPTTPPAPDAEG